MANLPPLRDDSTAVPQGYVPVAHPRWEYEDLIWVEPPLSSSLSDLSFLLPSSESEPSGSEAEPSSAEVAIDNLRTLCQDHQWLAQEVLREHLRKNQGPRTGWCCETSAKPTKSGGYVQVSGHAANKFAVLHELVLWADGQYKRSGEEVSHLCHNPRCAVAGHVCSEGAAENNRRKGCQVWVPCPHAGCRLDNKKILICPHEPACILYAEGFRDMAHLVAEGLCGDLSAEIRQRRR